MKGMSKSIKYQTRTKYYPLLITLMEMGRYTTIFIVSKSVLFYNTFYTWVETGLEFLSPKLRVAGWWESNSIEITVDIA